MTVLVAGAMTMPAVRAARWTPLLAALVVGYAMVGVPALVPGSTDAKLVVLLLRLAVLCAGLGVGFLFDDPARPTTATLPTPGWLPLAARVAAGGIVVAGWWWGTLATAEAAAGPAAAALPRRDLTLEAVTVVAVVLAVAALIWRRAARGTVGVVAVPAFLVVVFLVSLLPNRVALLVPLEESVWAAAHDRWMAALIAAVIVTLVATTWAGIGRARFKI